MELSLNDEEKRRFQEEILQALKKPKSALLHEAVKEGDEAMVKTFLRVGIDKNDLCDCRLGHTTPLMLAAWKGNHNLAGILLEAGALANVDGTHTSALHIAVRYSHFEIIEALIAAGADVNSQSFTYATPFHSAVGKGRLDELAERKGNRVRYVTHKIAMDPRIVKVLLAAGADKGARGIFGETTLICAVQDGEVHQARMLVAARPTFKFARRIMPSSQH